MEEQEDRWIALYRLHDEKCLGKPIRVIRNPNPSDLQGPYREIDRREAEELLEVVKGQAVRGRTVRLTGW